MPNDHQESPRDGQLTSGVPPTTGQLRAAETLALLHAGKLRHVFGTPAGWHWWDGKRWKPDSSNKARSALLSTIKQMAGLMATGQLPASTVSEMQKSSAQRGALEIASHLGAFATDLEDVDNHPRLLNVANGTLDLETFELLPHNPDHLLTQVTRAAYDPQASSQLWTDFLDVALPDIEVRQYLQRLVGYSLLGEVREHVFPILIGEGGNGKGTCYETIMWALGDYAAPFDSALLISSRNDYASANAPAPALLGLKGKRLVVTSETADGAKLATAKMKFYTGGDTITARAMYAKAETVFEPTHTMFMVTNYEPLLSSEDAAAWQRITTVPFNVKIRGTSLEIPGFTQQLRAAADAVLAWAVQGLRMYYEQGLAAPEQVRARTAQYHAKTDQVASFIAARLTPAGPDAKVPRSEVWNEWLTWAKAEGADPIKQSDFYAKVGEHFTQGKTAGVRVFRGVEITPDELPDDDVVLELVTPSHSNGQVPSTKKGS